MLDSVTINGIRIYDDYGYYLKSKSIELPEIQKYTQSVPYRNGIVDYTESMTGHATYENREIEIAFLCVGFFDQAMYDAFVNAYHGKTVTIVFDDDPDYYYTGLAEVGEVSKAGMRGWEFEVSCDCYPFKRSVDYIAEITANTAGDMTKTDIDITGIDAERIEFTASTTCATEYADYTRDVCLAITTNVATDAFYGKYNATLNTVDSVYYTDDISNIYMYDTHESAGASVTIRARELRL